MSESSDLARTAEENTQQIITPAIADWVALVEELQQIKLELIRDPSTDSQPQRTALLIVARIFNECRAVILLTEKGYALEAFSILATMTELAYTIGFIGDDEERAKRWRMHRSNEKQFVTVYDAALATVRHAGLPDDAANAAYEHYNHICMAKHGNPKVFYSFGNTKDGEGMKVYHGPYASREVEHLSRIAVWYACHYLWIGLTAYHDFHVREPWRDRRRDQLQKSLDAINRIRTADVQAYEREFPPG